MRPRAYLIVTLPFNDRQILMHNPTNEINVLLQFRTKSFTKPLPSLQEALFQVSLTPAVKLRGVKSSMTYGVEGFSSLVSSCTVKYTVNHCYIAPI